MKKLIIICFALLIGSNFLFAQQNIVEVEPIELSSAYLNIVKSIDGVIADNPSKAIELLNNVLEKTESEYERFNLIFWVLSFTHAGQGDFEGCLNILQKGQNDGLYYPLETEQRIFPYYLKELQKLDGYEAFRKKNEELKLQAQKNSVPEYMIELPEDYSKDKSYPLFLSFAGGWGSHIALSENWHSPKLKQEYIVAHLQGDQCMGSYLMSYDYNDLTKITAMYEKIVSKYSIDTSNIILGAQSAGTYFTLKLAVEKLIPIKGILLAFPHIPRNLDFLNYKVLEEQGVRLSILGGELDPRIIKTKELSVNFDNNGIKNRFIIFSEKGHEYPDDFQHQIDLSIDFICTPLSDK